MTQPTLFDDPDETTFEFYGSAIRYRSEGSGIWVDATDVARLLGYSQAQAMLRSLPKRGHPK